MKLRLMICAAAASTALFATENDPTSATYAVMNVEDAYTNTVIAVPWVGLESGDITISNLVNTTTLSVGDKLYFFAGQNGSGKDIWYQYEKKSNDGYWEGAETITSTGSYAADSQTVARGTGLILQRVDAGNNVLLCGRVADADTTTTFAANGKTLFANPCATNVALNLKMTVAAGATGTGPTNGDMITIPMNGGASYSYTYNATEGSWGTNALGTITRELKNGTKREVPGWVWTPCGEIPAGKGAWYINKGEAYSISW